MVEMKQIYGNQDEISSNKGLYELFHNKIYRSNILIMMIVWSFASFAFFMVPFYLTYVKANIFLLAISTDGAEILASLVCLCVTEVFDLKKALMMSCAVIATGAFAMIFISEQMSTG